MKVTRKAGKITALTETVRALGSTVGRVGWFPSAKYPDGKPVAGIAAVHEFGSAERGIPPRPFFRTTASDKRESWANTAAALTRAAAQGKIAPNLIVDALCQAAEGHVRETITKIQQPPLAQATVDARKRRLANGGAGAKATITKPLVDTGIMLATLTSEVQR